MNDVRDLSIVQYCFVKPSLLFYKDNRLFYIKITTYFL